VLVPPGPGPDLDQDVLRVVGVALDHRQSDLLFERLDLLRSLVDDLAQLRVLAILGQQLPRPFQIVLQGPVLLRQRLGGLQLAVLASDVRVALPIPDHGGIRHLRLELGKARLDLFDQRIDHASQHRRAQPFRDATERAMHAAQ